MKLTTSDDFLAKFDLPEKPSFEEFKNQLKIFYKTPKLVKQFFKERIEKNQDDIRKKNEDKIWEILYKWLVVKREDYIKYWFKTHIEINNAYVSDFTSFKIKDNGFKNNIIDGQKSGWLTRLEKNINFDVMYNTKKFHKADELGLMNILKLMFEKYTIRHTLVIPMGIQFIIKDDIDGIFSILRGTTNRPSVFNPYTFGWILQNLFKGKKLFTPVLGWNSYQVAFHNSNWSHYVGTDVIPSVIDNGKMLADYYNGGLFKDDKTVELYCTPSERLETEHDFVNKYKNYFDAILFSPPYFTTEIYDSQNQSTDTFPVYEDWLNGYWEETVKMCSKVVAPSGNFGFVVSNFNGADDCLKHVSNDMMKIASKYFKFEKHYKISWRNFSSLASDKMKEGNLEDLWFYSNK